jgi:hypothetical protein
VSKKFGCKLVDDNTDGLNECRAGVKWECVRGDYQ